MWLTSEELRMCQDVQNAVSAELGPLNDRETSLLAEIILGHAKARERQAERLQGITVADFLRKRSTCLQLAGRH